MGLKVEISLEMLADFASRFVRETPHEAGGGATIVGLKGDLGAGKTTFVQHVAQALGIAKLPTSPTFVIAQAYPVPGSSFKRLIHIDAYRLSPEEKDTIGWREYASNPENLILVEWPERLPWFPPHAPVLRFSVTGEKTREVEYEKN